MINKDDIEAFTEDPDEVEVRIQNVEGIEEALGRLRGMPNTPQTGVDVMYIAAMQLYACGGEKDEVLTLMSEVWDSAVRVVEVISEQAKEKENKIE